MRSVFLCLYTLCVTVTNGHGCSEELTFSTGGDSSSLKRALESGEGPISPQGNRPRLNSNKDSKMDKAVRLDNRSRKRLVVHRKAEDGANFSGELMYPRQPFETFGYDTLQGTYPLGRISTLGLITNPLRRVSVAEKWSPLEVATFEASMMTHGKRFNEIQRYVKTKTLKEVIEYYYSWKKTQHYKQWKAQFIPDPRTHPHLVALGDHVDVGEKDGETLTVDEATA